ncbi:MAG TPA: hypothetical protein VLM76_05915, partial [Patescibacteria group bacterium]|nr:hypothetical protein [Patescibacteria group bacterium]
MAGWTGDAMQARRASCNVFGPTTLRSGLDSVLHPLLGAERSVLDRDSLHGLGRRGRQAADAATPGRRDAEQAWAAPGRPTPCNVFGPTTLRSGLDS